MTNMMRHLAGTTVAEQAHLLKRVGRKESKPLPLPVLMLMSETEFVAKIGYAEVCPTCNKILRSIGATK